MKVKLTLSLSKEAIEKAKRIAARKGMSVSKMTEEYFELLEEEAVKNPFAEIKRRMEPHRERILKSLPKDKSFKEIVNDWRYEDLRRELEPQPKQSKRRKNEKVVR